MTRIAKTRDYLFDIINTLTQNRKYQINANFLGDVGDFSLDKIPTEIEEEKWIIGIEKHKDDFNFRSRKAYSSDITNNLTNIGFFEDFADIIKSNNEKRILPDIEGIESIECLNSGTLNNEDGTKAIFDIQIRITYRDNIEKEVVSL